MRLNINDRFKAPLIKKTLLAAGVSLEAVEKIEKARESGLVLKEKDDLKLLNVLEVDARLVGDVMGFGTPATSPSGSAPEEQTKIIEIEFKPIAIGPKDQAGVIADFDPQKYFWGYQFIFSYINLSGFTVEESFPIVGDNRVYVEYVVGQFKANSKIKYEVKSPTGELAFIAKAQDDPSKEKLIEITPTQLSTSSIKVGIVEPEATTIDPLRESYQVKGKLISNLDARKTEGFQVVIWASTDEPQPGGEHEFYPVAHGETETNGYFITTFLHFPDKKKIDDVKRAKATVLKGEFKKEFPIQPLLDDNKPQIPDRLILVLEDDLAGGNDKDCGCNELNFLEKKAKDVFSFHTVVRTTEPSVVADVLEDEASITIEDFNSIFGIGIQADALSGLIIRERIPISVFRKFKYITSKADHVIGRGDNAFTLLKNLLSEQKAKKIIKEVENRTFKGRTNLSPINQIDWDDEPTIYQAASIAHGHLLQFKQEWMPDGYSIGDLLYSLPLAPGQKKQIAVLDWERRESAANTQSLDYSESLYNELSRDRDINEIVNSTLTESISASSSSKTKGIGAGYGSAIMGVIPGVGTFGSLMGVSGGRGRSSSSANQDSSREIAANSSQSINDRTIQAANAVRSQRSTVIQTISQGESVSATTESVANYNHCHALTIQYFQVLRHWAIQTRLVSVQECLFIPLQITPFDIEKSLRWRTILEQVLLKQNLFPGFEALARIEKEKESFYTNYYDSIGFPQKNYAEQNIEIYAGELEMEFNFFNPENKITSILVSLFNNLGADLSTHVDKKLTNLEFATLIGPRIIEFVLDKLIVRTDKGTDLKLDSSLISTFRPNVPLRVTLRQTASTSASVQRDQIEAIVLRLANLTNSETDSFDQLKDKYMKIKIRNGSLSYRTSNFGGFLFKERIDNDLFVGDGVYIPTPLNKEELRNPRKEDLDFANRLVDHLNENMEYYHKAIWFGMTSERRFMLLDGMVAPGKANGRSVASVVENRLIGIVGNCLVMPVAQGFQLDPTISDDLNLMAMYYSEINDPFRLSLPTRGVYAEAVMGQCNSCEEKDETRFWRWEESPIPDSPTTPILPLSTDSRRADPGNLQPQNFPNPMINIQNAPNVPDPTGLQAALALIGKGDAFRDLTGLNQNQLNALAAFQKSMDTAKGFGEEAAELAKEMYPPKQPRIAADLFLSQRLRQLDGGCFIFKVVGQEFVNAVDGVCG